jgi:hypothetical protein
MSEEEEDDDKDEVEVEDSDAGDVEARSPKEAEEAAAIVVDDRSPIFIR